MEEKNVKPEVKTSDISDLVEEEKSKLRKLTKEELSKILENHRA